MRKLPSSTEQIRRNHSGNTTNSYTFTANAGDSVVVRVGQLTAAGNFNPWLRIYGPDGALVGSGAIAGDVAEEIALTPTNSGTFTVLVSDGNYGGYSGTGTYQLDYLKVPGDYVVPPGDDGGPLTNGTLNVGTISVGDLDAWSFTANAGDSVVVRVGQLTAAGNFNPWLRIYGPDGALVGSGAIAGDVAEEVALTRDQQRDVHGVGVGWELWWLLWNRDLPTELPQASRPLCSISGR